jgi:hypothetical protein
MTSDWSDAKGRSRILFARTISRIASMRGLPNGIGGAVLVGDYLYGTEVWQLTVSRLAV